MATFNQRNITEFRSRLSGGGARANLFEVEIAFPEELGINLTDVSDKVPFLVKAAEIPCLLYTSPSPRDRTRSRMPSSA